MDRTKLIEIVKHTIAARAAGQRVSRIDRKVRKHLHNASCDDNRPCPACASWHQNNDANRAFERHNLRDLNLAYAYLRGVPYAVVERKSREMPSMWGAGLTVWNLLDKKTPQQPLHEDVKAWFAGKAPAWPSFPGEVLARYRRLMRAVDRAADGEHYATLTGRGDAVWAVLTHEERVLIENEEEAAAAAGRAA